MTGNGERDGLKRKRLGNQQPSVFGNEDKGSTTIETSLSSNYNRIILYKVGSIMGAMEGVNHNKRQRGYEARDKEEIIKLDIHYNTSIWRY